MREWLRGVSQRLRSLARPAGESGRSSPGEPPAAQGPMPAVVGVGRTGMRVTSSLAAGPGRGLRLAAVFAEAVPGGPTSVPVLTWPGAEESLRRRLADAPAVVVAVGLGAPGAAAVAPQVARCLAGVVRHVAAVGVAPFSFEGRSRAEYAESVARELATVADVVAVASRDDVRGIVPGDTPLERACERVDEIATLVAEALARALARRREPLDLAGVVCGAGAAQASGPDAVSQALREAVHGSLVRPERLSGSGGAMVTLVLGRTPTVAEVCAAEDALRESLALGADVTFDIVTDPAVGDRALAAVCVAPDAGPAEDGLFPSEDPRVLEVPAFVRRRSSGRGGSRPGSMGWPKSA